MKEESRKRTLYIPESIDKLVRHQAIEENKRFSEVAVECFKKCFEKKGAK